MSIIKKIAIASIAIIGGVVAAGFLAPDHVVVTRQAVTTATPTAVIRLASSSDGYQTFNPYKAADPALKITAFGPASGVGSGFNFDGKDGKGSTTIVAQTSTRVDYQIKLDGMGAPTQAIQTKVTPAGTHIEWSMRMEFGNNPAMRLMGLMMPSMMGPTLEDGLSNLKKVAVEV
jgi:Polyketide cyclase / dehydrase and lipid transport